MTARYRPIIITFDNLGIPLTATVLHQGAIDALYQVECGFAEDGTPKLFFRNRERCEWACDGGEDYEDDPGFNANAFVKLLLRVADPEADVHGMPDMPNREGNA